MSLITTVGPSGGIKNRLDIVDFVQDEKLLTLYVRALRKYVSCQLPVPPKY
jgi:tyrosinase